jgi:hypothetical protein
MTSKDNDAPGMKGDRSRTKRGPLRRKRDDTLVGRIEKEYDRNFGVRSEMKLGTLLRREDQESLNDLLHDE